MRRPRDSQRQAVYNWERRVLTPGPVMSLAKCQTAVATIWASVMGCEPSSAPAVTDGRSRRRACYSWHTHTIKLPTWARTMEVVIHEVAHAVVRARAGMSVAAHGPEFMRVFIELLVAFGGYDYNALIAGLNRKIKVCGTMELPWRRS